MVLEEVAVVVAVDSSITINVVAITHVKWDSRGNRWSGSSLIKWLINRSPLTIPGHSVMAKVEVTYKVLEEQNLLVVLNRSKEHF